MSGKTGMTPIAYMDSLGLFENGGGLFHGVHLDEADFDIMKKKKYVSLQIRLLI